ncbi:MAG TPA: ABC transporter permease [Candidatus Dormibacteraeota bacterium]|nr:ABC transporter permease [Candidatus Dormibacteraeota bacterium]
MRALRRRRLLAGLTLEAGVPLALLALWWTWSTRAGLVFFPPLPDILRSFRETWLAAPASKEVLPSLGRLAVGYATAVLAGVGLGTLLGCSEAARRSADPIVQFLRGIPPPALLPFGILVFGIGDPMKVLMIALVCLWPVLLNTIDGVGGVDPTLRETSRVYGLPLGTRLAYVILPAASPQIVAGARTGLSLAIIMMVISEMVASTNGIGYSILEAQQTFRIPDMWAGILVLGVLGYLLNGLFVLLERRLLRWHRGARAREGV